MREITIGEKQITVRANPLTLLFYKQEFKSDLVGDLMSMRDMQKDPSQFDSVIFLQLVWAMGVAKFLAEYPSFTTWLADLGSIDFGDKEMIGAVVEEAIDGFFRGRQEQQSKPVRNRARKN